jgi:two-component system cell cycle response regulator
MEPARRRILLIDDDELQFRLTQAHFRHFRGEPFALDWEPTFAGGLARLLSGEYAACFLDFLLGERDGLELIREATARGCRTPIVFLTADRSGELDMLAMHAGAMDFLVKGELTPAALERSLRYALKLSETLQSLHELATRDELTGLYNRREFQRRRGLEEEQARQEGGAFALIMLDLDHFKRVNDEHGHAAGDEVLREAARRLGVAVRDQTVGRIGGDEFAVLLPGATPAQARACAERLRAAIAAAPVPVGGAAISVTASVGVAVLAENGGDLLAAADQALYRAKEAGRNRVDAAVAS